MMGKAGFGATISDSKAFALTVILYCTKMVFKEGKYRSM